MNDIDLIGNWFYVDPNIANPRKLKAMLDELGPMSLLTNSLDNACAWVKTFWEPKLLPIVFAAVLLAVRRPTWSVTVLWGLCIAIVFILGLSGRPAVLRVYVPLVGLLMIAPFMASGIRRDRFAIGVILVAAIMNTSSVFSESKRIQNYSNQIRQGLTDFPTSPVVVWGGTFPFEAAYPVLKQPESAMSYRLAALGVFTLAPFTVASVEEKTGRGMLYLLAGERGVPIIATEQRFGLLDIYCKEHLHGQLEEVSAKKYGRITISWHRCEIGK